MKSEKAPGFGAAGTVRVNPRSFLAVFGYRRLQIDTNGQQPVSLFAAIVLLRKSAAKIQDSRVCGKGAYCDDNSSTSPIALVVIIFGGRRRAERPWRVRGPGKLPWRARANGSIDSDFTRDSGGGDGPESANDSDGHLFEW